MAYCTGPTTALKYSTSLIPGNLAVCEDTNSLTYGVAHKNCINVVRISAGVCTHEQATFDDGGDKDPASYLTQVQIQLLYRVGFIWNVWGRGSIEPCFPRPLQARWCRLQSSRVVLVLTCYKGFKVDPSSLA